MPLSLKSARSRVERFLAASDLRLDDVDYYAVVTRLGEDTILAGGGLEGNIIKCIAVDNSLRGTGMSQRLVSHLLSTARERGASNIKVYTKPQNTEIFESLAFRPLASAPQAVLMESSIGGLDNYLQYLEQQRRPGNNGAIVMNCNPFTLGHLYLVKQAASQVDNLYVIIVKEDVSMFRYTERLDMARQACADLYNVTVLEGSDYAISAATFPTYFLKRLDDASDTHMTLDIDLFARHIAPALGVTKRFVGTEPDDQLTRRYNELMAEQLPQHGIALVEIDRIASDDALISASRVRQSITGGTISRSINLVPTTTAPYIIAKAATLALEQELNTTPKPGLIDKHDNGAHHDMDYNTMMASIGALSHHFIRLGQMGWDKTLPTAAQVQQVGIEAECDMLKATAGVNTHRGALFSMGLCIVAVAHALRNGINWVATVKAIAEQIPANTNSNGALARKQHNIMGALDMARDGYSQLTSSWLPALRENLSQDNPEVRTLLLIMSMLDDTNVIHRVGYNRAQQVKTEARSLLDNFSIQAVEALNREYIAQNISPGGAADMLALTLFINSTTKQ